MTDEQIIKAFEEILKNQNNKLSLIERAVCDDVLSLTNRQKAEIEELRSDIITRHGIAAALKAKKGSITYANIPVYEGDIFLTREAAEAKLKD